jgi:hypothetical protein
MRKLKTFHLFLAAACLSSLIASLVLTLNETTAAPNQPQSTNALDTNFPTTAPETYKIEVDQDGIYEITYSDLITAGMNVAAVNPNTIEMMVRGQPVAYQFVNDNGDSTFDPDESIRFYGWAFDGPQTEKQFITNNVFWLWAGGTPTIMGETANLSGGEVVTSLRTAVTKEPETLFTTTYTDQWDTFPNEPDSWYWDLVKQADFPTKTYTIDLPHLTTVGPETTAEYTIELLSREQSTNPTGITYLVRGSMNSYSSYGQATWTEVQSVNIINTIPLSELNAGTNNVRLDFLSSSGEAKVYLNRITVEYQRELVSDGKELIFSDSVGGSRQFQVSGFTENSPAVWNITVPTTPIDISGIDIVVDGSTYEYRISSNHAAGAKFIATTTANTRPPLSITKYIPASLEPPAGGADWIAISHADFLAQANALAAHRASFSDMQTWVVDIEDVVNQYGYGLHLPSAIRDYLKHSLSWTTRPGYIAIFGAATYNPRNLDCADDSCPRGSTTWDKNQRTFVVTDLVYEDRFQGQIPSDHTLVLLENDDLIADIAVGRITAETAAEAQSVVDKIILYEQTQLTAAPWQKNILFVADNTDVGDTLNDFCLHNQVTIDGYIPNMYKTIQRCLPDASVGETQILRDQMLDDINNTGISILNYRGHGHVWGWATPTIISTLDSSLDFWINIQKPTVVLSADCLDGNFAFPGIDALSKTLITLKSGAEPVGAAAFWSSSGLGYTNEHSVLHQGFYDGLFQQNLLTIGDAINYAKLNYHQSGYNDSELFSFILQGDPAMQMFTMRNEVFLPVTIK